MHTHKGYLQSAVFGFRVNIIRQAGGVLIQLSESEDLRLTVIPAPHKIVS